MSTSELYAVDVEALVCVLEEAREDDPGPAMPWSLLAGLQRLIPCDLEVSYQHHEYRASRTLVIHAMGEDGERFGPEGPTPSDPDDLFWQYWWHGLCSWPQRSGDLRRVIQTRDFFPTEQARLASPLGEIIPEVRGAMIVSLPAAPGQARRICFMRYDHAEFTERER